jgi:hypothetical protein
MSASIDSMGSSVPGTGRTFRTEGSMRFAAACGLIGAIWLIYLGATTHSASSTSTAGRVFAFVWAVLLIASSIRMLTLGVLTTNDHVRIRNFFKTRQLRWSDIEEFSFGQFRIFPAIGSVRLRDGTGIAISGISLGRAARKRARANAASLVAELNQLLEERRADAYAGRRQPS